MHADDKALDALLKSVNALLQARTPFGGSQGYKQDSQHVHQVANAISDVLRGLRIEVRAEPFGVADAVHSLQRPPKLLPAKVQPRWSWRCLWQPALPRLIWKPLFFWRWTRSLRAMRLTPAGPDENWDPGLQLSVWNMCAVNALVDHTVGT
ncbi:hypothetical protein EMGBD1_00180 [Anaerolineaceae bacterium]|nr:hypothetical protein EMGBD1_00180 [Anaerolineaceae bacterium]